MALLDTTATVITPERVPFRYRLAGPGPRAMAWAIDAMLRLVLLLFLVALATLAALLPGLGEGSVGPLLVGAFLLEWWYGAILETLLQGRTPGKWALGLRVVRVDGAPARFPDFVLRNLLRGVDFLPGFYAFGAAVMVADERLRRLGDLVAGTVVVREDRAEVLERVSLEPPVTEEERRSLPARVPLDRGELAVIESFLRRRSKLAPLRVEELAAQLGPKLSERTGITAPTWERVLVLAYARATGRDRGEP